MTTTAQSLAIVSFTKEHALFGNFFRYPVTIDGVTYPTSEHAYQALKSDDPTIRLWIRDALSPSEAKRRGHSIPLHPKWNTVLRFQKMEQVLSTKFQIGSHCRKHLDSTDQLLVEGNAHNDWFWGAVWIERRIPREHEIPVWARRNGLHLTGHNVLGRMLMTIRDGIRPEPPSAPIDIP